MATVAERASVENLQLTLWLAVNYEETNEEFETDFDSIYTKCKTDFESQNLSSPSKYYVSLALKCLFNIGKSRKYENKQERIVYSKLRTRVKQVSESIRVPDHCVATKTHTDELILTCPTLWIVNGIPQTVSLQFSKVVLLKSKDRTVELPISRCLAREDLTGWTYFLECLKHCQGYSTKDTNPQKGGCRESWVLVGGRKETERTRAKKCLVFSQITSSNWNLCRPCDDAFQTKSKKRKMDKENMNDNSVLHTQNNVIREPLAAIEQACNPNTNVPNIPEHIIQMDIDSRGSDNEEHVEAGCGNDDGDDSILLVESDHDEMMKVLDSLIKIGTPAKMLPLIKDQLKNGRNKTSPHQRRWSQQVISLCLGLYCRSPAAYRDLKASGMLVMPSQRLLRYYKNSVKQFPGLNNDYIDWMAKEAARQGIPQFGMSGGILIDEMSLQTDVQFVRQGSEWQMVGGVDMGDLNNTISSITSKGKKTVKLATHALQFVFHGFTGFRWPVCYYGSATAPAHQLWVNFWGVVDKLDDYGFSVEYIMYDGASTNRSLSNLMFPKGTSLRESEYITRNIFDMGSSVCVIQDIMHVLKKFRNNIESSTLFHKNSAGRYLEMNGKPIVWNHWIDAHKYNEFTGIRIHYKLTNEHFDLSSASKMRNHLATQVLDKDMLYLMSSYRQSISDPSSLDSTIQLLKNTSVLVDIFTDRKAITSKLDERLKKLRDVLDYFQTWEKAVMDDDI